MEAFDDTTPFERYTLLAVLAHHHREETPVQSYGVRDFCVEHLSTLDGPQFEGGISRESVIRTLSILEDKGLLGSEVVDGSPVGKGRPAYRLAVDVEKLDAAFVDDSLLHPVAKSIAD